MRASIATVLLLVSCGGGAPRVADAPRAAPAEAVPASAAAESKPEETAPSTATAPSATAPSATAPSATAAAGESSVTSDVPPSQNESPPLPTRSAGDTITARDLAFVIDYASSEPHSTADATCEKDGSDDPAKRASCLQKARDKFLADVLRFEKDAQGKLSLAIYKRNGETLSELYVGSIAFTEDAADSVHVKWTGKSRGQRPIFRGKEDMVVSVPNAYSLELNDPQLGKLVYNAKIGLVAK